MEKLICGSEVRERVDAEGKSPFCDFFAAVKKGHPECGDSAFVYSDREMFIAAVLDGVSGEPGASFASSDAAKAILDHLKAVKEPSESAVKEALTKAHLAIRIGSTTATIFHMSKDGSFIVASIGDSPAYGIDTDGKISLELNPSRAVKDDDSILKYFYYRNLVTSVLGSQTELDVSMRKGRLKKGQTIILASDGVSDNLFVHVKDGYVTDSSGIGDLAAIIGKLRTPRAIACKILETVEKRIRGGRVEEPGRMLVPKEDDIAVIAIRRI
ncbi:MAG: protein phosphatase 2C domain-containing protein [Candidatus Micrarchaeota archaeon]